MVCVNALPIAISLSKLDSRSIFKSLAFDLPPSMYILWMSSGTCKVLRSTGHRFSSTPGIPRIHPNMLTKQVFCALFLDFKKASRVCFKLNGPLIFQGSYILNHTHLQFVSLKETRQYHACRVAIDVFGQLHR